MLILCLRPTSDRLIAVVKGFLIFLLIFKEGRYCVSFQVCLQISTIKRVENVVQSILCLMVLRCCLLHLVR